MCGISGFNWGDKKTIDTMVSRLSHRGPDAQGIFVDEGVSLGHNRLAVIDLSEDANQPMFDVSGDLVIVYNGEIYNFQELKKELKGYPFRTKSDTEVILAGYKKWGESVVEKLNGMFAFAIWDKKNETLFLARDHAGIKPLYYFWDGKKFIFASEIKAILEHDVPRKLNYEAFNYYLRVLYVPEPLTMIESIHKLPPSSTLTLKVNEFSVHAYNCCPVTSPPTSYSDAQNMLKDIAGRAVKRHLISDVPIGVYLSGGIDSSTVLSLMARSTQDIKTFSVGFELGEGEERHKFNYDFELAKKTASFFGTKHYPFTVNVNDIVDSFEEATSQNDDITAHPTAVPMMLLARYAKKEVTVVLNGSGGDELFGGYDRYRIALAAHYYKQLPKHLRMVGDIHKRVRKLDYVNTIDLFAQFMFEKDHKLSKVISPQVFQKDRMVKDYFYNRYVQSREGDPADQFMRIDQESWLPDYFFNLSDKMSMKSALEERVPLVDRDLVAFSRSLPRSYKLDLFRTKRILKDTFKKDLPDFLFDQPKRGWFSPGAKWLRNERFTEFVHAVLSEDYNSKTKELFDWPSVETMLDEHIDKTQYNLTILWTLLTFQVWAKYYRIDV